MARLFRDFTVERNIIAASYLYPKVGFWEAVFYTARYRKKEAQIKDEAIKILQFVSMDNQKDEVARNLPHGYQKLLGIAIALATKPKLLLLDEPVAGMSPKEVDRALEIISEIRRRGTTILLIEHNMAAVMNICERIVVLNFGTEIAHGSPEEVSRNQDVIQAYLGVGKNAT